jgi:hypothetical protein
MWAQQSLAVNERRQLGYPNASYPREEDILSTPDIVGHRSMAFQSTGAEPMKQGSQSGGFWL